MKLFPSSVNVWLVGEALLLIIILFAAWVIYVSVKSIIGLWMMRSSIPTTDLEDLNNDLYEMALWEQDHRRHRESIQWDEDYRHYR